MIVMENREITSEELLMPVAYNEKMKSNETLTSWNEICMHLC